MATKLYPTQIKVLSHSVVMVWAKSAPEPPQLDQIKARSIFNKPNLTHYSIDGNGASVAEAYTAEEIKKINETTFSLTTGLKPHINIGTQRYTNINSDLEQLLNVHDNLGEQFDEIDSNYRGLLLVGQMGVNIDYELNFSGSFSAAEWFKSKFITNESSEGFQQVVGNEFKFTVVEDGVNKFCVVTVQPRGNDDRSIYIAVNDHFQISPISQFGRSAEIRPLLDESYRKFVNQIVNLLFNK